MKKVCPLCDKEFDTIKNGHTRVFCFECVPQFKLGDREQHQKSMNIKHKRIKEYLVKYKGGKCERCGYDRSLRALEFHHPDNNKEFGISQTFRSLEAYIEEVDKCILLCSNCHAEEHERLEEMGA